MVASPESLALIATALVVGVTHTLIGPDHYLPFIALSKARGWKTPRTLWITFICGLGHVAGSVLIGLLGLGLGWGLGGLEIVESVRGEIAAWLLTVFGCVYLAWAIKQIGQRKPHTHLHSHNGTLHVHEHTHTNDHAHPHVKKKKGTSTAWSLFIIFIFGPCEAFIPILLFPSVQHNWHLVAGVTLAFAIATIGTMLAMVYLLGRGLVLFSFKPFEHYGHVAAGIAIVVCATAIHLGF